MFNGPEGGAYYLVKCYFSGPVAHTQKCTEPVIDAKGQAVQRGRRKARRAEIDGHQCMYAQCELVGLSLLLHVRTRLNCSRRTLQSKA